MADARALYREGFQHFADDHIDEAIDCYQRAVDAEPDLAIAWNGLSMTLKRKGDLDGAIEAGLKIVELDPEDTAAHRDLGRSLLESDSPIEAAEIFARAIGLAEAAGDIQTGHEIHAFLRQAEKRLDQH